MEIYFQKMPLCKVIFKSRVVCYFADVDIVDIFYYGNSHYIDRGLEVTLFSYYAHHKKSTRFLSYHFVKCSVIANGLQNVAFSSDLNRLCL